MFSTYETSRFSADKAELTAFYVRNTFELGVYGDHSLSFSFSGGNWLCA